MFYSVFTMFMLAFMFSSVSAMQERPLIIREYSQSMYTLNSLHMSRLFMDMIILFAMPLVYALIVYFGIGLTATFG